MGLDTSHDCWHGAYSAFYRWRKEIAKAAGLPPLELMEGFYEPPDEQLISRTAPRALAFSPSESGGMVATRGSVGAVLADAIGRGDAGRWESWTDRFRDDLPIMWSALKPDPLHKLLHHSDCEGELDWKDATGIADSLERILPSLPEGEAWGHIGNWRDKTQKFINGLRLAASKKENVNFH